MTQQNENAVRASKPGNRITIDPLVRPETIAVISIRGDGTTEILSIGQLLAILSSRQGEV